MEASSLLSKRYTFPSTSFDDPAIVTCAFAQKEQGHTSLSSSTTTQQTLVNDYEGDENATSTSPVTAQNVSPPQLAVSTSLDHLWSKQEKYDDLSLRLLALEESEKWFEDRIRLLEKRQNHTSRLKQHGGQLMKPTAARMYRSLDINQNHYMELYHLLLKKYSTLQQELETKEKLYIEKIQELTNTIASTTKNDRKTSYKEENGYLLFDTTTMNGVITQCRIKIPMPCNRQQTFASKSPASHASTISSSPARFMRIKPPLPPRNRH